MGEGKPRGHQIADLADNPASECSRSTDFQRKYAPVGSTLYLEFVGCATIPLVLFFKHLHLGQGEFNRDTWNYCGDIPFVCR